ncbi:farnesyl pyrophosphate synthase-like isoform X2 [Bacillus rossius redtenbacheri]|uniref:farnesyl pyrophosphate synthase-like isoform X2 n=1 Tax=Bacillus rossius redtenbacheri TaxID=93214 RepID=UPI002FDD345F
MATLMRTALRGLAPLAAACPTCQLREFRSTDVSAHAHPSRGRLARSALGRAVAPNQLRSGAARTDVFEFSKLLPNVVRDLTETGRHLDVPEATKRLAKILQYNVTGGKKNRGLGVVTSYRMLAREEELTAENIELAYILGWCLEMLHGSLLMTQDALDRAETRRGKPCWYLTSQTSPLVAVNDANLLVSAIYQLLKSHLARHPGYVYMVELFQDVCHKATMGQVLDIQTRADKSLQQFTMERYKAITKYKTVYHTFQMPVSLALYMAGIYDMELHRQAKTILMEMGQFYQAMADYMNCYEAGDEGFGARSGSDISDGKCTWLSVLALQRASPAQLGLLQECYGQKEPQKVDQVRDLYDELGLPVTYRQYEEHTYDLLCTQIQQVSKGLPHKLFFKMLDNVYVKNVPPQDLQ